MSEYVHIVCLDAPSPPDYGGAIDMYYKIVSLASAGKKIILHYFNYHKHRDVAGLERFCSEIHSYERTGFFRSFSFGRPFIVRSRSSRKLAHRLNQDNYPILLEGIHCSGILPALDPSRSVVIRMHNEESSYYKSLAATEKNPVKKAYMLRESFLLHQYYATLPRSSKLAVISTTDMDLFRLKYNLTRVYHIPCFVPWQEIKSQEGKGAFCLYHGNMQVSENAGAAKWLVKEVFSRTDIPFIIAGKDIPQDLLEMERHSANVRMVNNPSMDQLNELVTSAHINVLPSLNQTGVKLKLLHSMFEGRFCMSNNHGIAGSGIEGGIVIANDTDAYIHLISGLFERSFTVEDKKNRQQLLTVYNNFQNAQALSALL